MNQNTTLLSRPASMLQHWYEESQKGLLLEATDVQHLEIYYFKFDKPRGIDIKDVPIDYTDAVDEMKSLSVEIDKMDAFIGFNNHRTKELLQFIRKEEDLWIADVPIITGASWNGYLWDAKANTESILYTLRLFFEEANWFETLDFILSRCKKSWNKP